MGKTNVSQHSKHDPVNQITGQDHPRPHNPVDDQPARDMFQRFRHVLAECLQEAATNGQTKRPFSNRLENRQAPWPTKERSQPGCR